MVCCKGTILQGPTGNDVKLLGHWFGHTCWGTARAGQ